MSTLPFDVPHLDAIRSLPHGLLYPHQADGVVCLIAKGRAILADDTQDEFIAELLEAKLRLIGAVAGDVPPDASILDDLYAKLRSRFAASSPQIANLWGACLHTTIAITAKLV